MTADKPEREHKRLLRRKELDLEDIGVYPEGTVPPEPPFRPREASAKQRKEHLRETLSPKTREDKIQEALLIRQALALPLARIESARMETTNTPIDFAAASRQSEAKKVDIYSALLAGYRQDEVAFNNNIPVSEVEAIVDEMTDRTMRVTQASLKTAAAIDLDRLDALLKVLWVEAMAGDVAHIDRCLKVMERRNRILNIDGGNALQQQVDNSNLQNLSVTELQELRRLQEKAGMKAAK